MSVSGRCHKGEHLGFGSAPQRGHRAPLEPLTQRNYALSGGNEIATVVVPTNKVVVQTAQRGRVSMGADRKANTVWGGGALERGHGAPLERLAQLGDALSSVCAFAILVDAAELVKRQAAKGRRRVNGR